MKERNENAKICKKFSEFCVYMKLESSFFLSSNQHFCVIVGIHLYEIICSTQTSIEIVTMMYLVEGITRMFGCRMGDI